jgi:hypothetical protein
MSVGYKTCLCLAEQGGDGGSVESEAADLGHGRAGAL